MDAHLRQLERKAAQGDLEAAGQLLVEQVRRGELSDERLALLAHLGHAPARAALPDVARHAELLELSTWIRDLQRWPGASALAAVAAAHPVLAVWEAWEPGELAPRSQLRTTLDACQAWALAPDDVEAREAAEESVGAAQQVMDDLQHLLTTLDEEHHVITDVAWRALDCGWGVVTCLQACLHHLHGGRRRGRLEDAGWAAHESSRALKLGPEPFRTAVRDALVPWALAYTPAS